MTLIKTNMIHCNWSGKYIPMTAVCTGKRKTEGEVRNRNSVPVSSGDPADKLLNFIRERGHTISKKEFTLPLSMYSQILHFLGFLT